MANLTVRNKLFLGFGLVLLMMLSLVVVGVKKVNYIDTTLEEITNVNAAKQRLAINFRGSVHDRAISVRDIVLLAGTEKIGAIENDINRLAEFYQTSENSMQKMIDSGVDFSANEMTTLKKIADIQASILPKINQIIAFADKNDRLKGEQYLSQEVGQQFTEWLSAINAFIDYQEGVNKVATTSAREVASGFSTLMVIITSIATIIGVAIAIIISSDLSSKIGAEPSVAFVALAEMSEGDLSNTHETCCEKSVMGSVIIMQQKLKQIVSNIFEASQKLAVQTAEVKAGSQISYNAAQLQASLTVETSERLSKMRVGLGLISDAVSQSEKNSEETSKFAKLGKQKVDESVNEMELISTTVGATVDQIKQLENRTKEIGSIVSVISSISEQTNLLALNAAIEAARAGETGRGFAVVADEVRQLAQRTGEATSQIEGMINDVQKETAASVIAMEKTQPLVENGKALTIETTELLLNIEQQAGDSLLNVRKVSEATNEQVNFISSISESMEQINIQAGESIDTLQRNGEVIGNLNELSSRLKSSVGYFTI